MNLTPALTGLPQRGRNAVHTVVTRLLGEAKSPSAVAPGTDASGVSADDLANTLGGALLGIQRGGPLGELLELDGRTVAEPALAHGFVQRFVAVDDDDIRAMLAAIRAAGYTTFR
jgi:hypothetical protein